MDDGTIRVWFMVACSLLVVHMMIAYALLLNRLIEQAWYNVPLVFFGWITNIILFSVALAIVSTEVTND